MPASPMFRALTGKEIALHTILLTLVFEAVTIVFRFGLGCEATRDTASTIGALTYGVRIHHAYVGLLVLAVARGIRTRRPALWTWGLAIGMALVLSDLIHHFLVLWPILGDPMFHLVYP